MYSVSFIAVTLGNEEGFFLKQLVFRRCISSYVWKKCYKKQGSSHLKQLTMENCVLNICNNILTLYPINFYIFYCFFHLFSLICQHCNCILLPLQPIFTLFTVVCDWDVTASMCVWTHAIEICKPHYLSVLFSVPFAVCHKAGGIEKKKKNHASLSTRHVTSSVMKYNPVRWWNSTVIVRQASIEDLTTAVSVNGLLLSVLLLHCVDFVIWNKCLFSFCMFFTMLKVAAIALLLLYSRNQFFLSKSSH